MGKIFGKTKNPGEKKSTHPFFALMVILVAVTILANVIPSGEYVRETVDGITKVDPESYHIVEKQYAGIGMFFMSFYHGFVNTASLMALLFFVGFGFGVLQDIKLLETAVYKLSRTMRNVPFIVLCLVMGTVFMVLNWFTGLYDLAVVFIPMMVPLCLALGYDVMTGVGLVNVYMCVGFAAALANPWFTGIAHPIAELPTYSGMTYRLICSLVLFVPATIYLMRYASKVKKDPTKSILYGETLPYQAVDENADLKFTPRLIVAGIAFVAIFAYMIYGSLKKGFSYGELTACFAAMGLVCALIMGKGLNEICDMMARGMKNMFMASMVMLFARSILYIMTETAIIDTVIYSMASLIKGLPETLTAVGMFWIQTIINFFIPSGSGQASLTMPIMVPLADMGGITRQVACLASQFGDGFSNFLWPTVGSLLAILGGTGIPYGKWAKWFLPLFLIFTVVASVLIVVAVKINYGPF